MTDGVQLHIGISHLMVFPINSEFQGPGLGKARAALSARAGVRKVIMTARPNERLGATNFPAVAPDEPFAIYYGATAAAARTLWQVLEATAEAFPGAVAIDDGQSVCSYYNLLRE